MALVQPGYPTEFPTVALGVLADKLRGKEVPTGTAIHACWVVSGWALGNFVPTDSPQVVGANLESEEQQAVFVETMIQNKISGNPVGTFFPWNLLITIALNLILKLSK
jgi:hypothetical protein